MFIEGVEVKTPSLIDRGFSEDYRGSVEYCNDIDLSFYKRFYFIHNPKQGTVRAWHGHKKEAKLVKVISGKFIIVAVEIDNWDEPSKSQDLHEFEMQADSGFLFIPPGYANGAMNLDSNSSALYFSSFALKEASSDDYRFDSKYWDPWTTLGGKIFE